MPFPHWPRQLGFWASPGGCSPKAGSSMLWRKPSGNRPRFHSLRPPAAGTSASTMSWKSPHMIAKGPPRIRSSPARPRLVAPAASPLPWLDHKAQVRACPRLVAPAASPLPWLDHKAQARACPRLSAPAASPLPWLDHKAQARACPRLSPPAASPLPWLDHKAQARANPPGGPAAVDSTGQPLEMIRGIR